MGRKERVLVRRAETYNPVTISEIIGDGLREFGLGDRVRGRVTIKPNVVMAHHKVTPSAYTRSEFLDGLLTALETNAQPGTSSNRRTAMACARLSDWPSTTMPASARRTMSARPTCSVTTTGRADAIASATDMQKLSA